MERVARVSAAERAHFERVRLAGEAEEREVAAALDPERSLARVGAGLRLGEEAPTSPAIEAMIDARASGQAGLASRGRALGLRGVARAKPA